MSHDEALDRALDELMAGRAVDATDPTLPPDAQELLDAAHRLAKGRAALAGEPRPGFVLELEDQLRADLRTGLARRVRGAQRRTIGLRIAAAALLMFGALLSALLLSRQATVGQPLYPLKRLVESARLRLSSDGAEQASLLCDQAWGRLLELQSIVTRPGRGDRDVPRTLDGIVDGYGEALMLAGAIEGDPRVLWNAQSGTAYAADALAALAEDGALGEEEREAIEAARQALYLLLLDSRVAAQPPADARTPRDEAVPPMTATPRPAAGAAPGESELRRPVLPGRPGDVPRRPPEEAPPSATLPVRADPPGTDLPPTPGSPTSVPPAATRTIVPTATTEPTAITPPEKPPRAPSATLTPAPSPQPTNSATDPIASATPKKQPTLIVEPTVAPPEPTPWPTERPWPTETVPPMPVEPSATPPAPGDPSPAEPTSSPEPPAPVPSPTAEPPDSGAGGALPGAPSRP